MSSDGTRIGSLRQVVQLRARIAELEAELRISGEKLDDQTGLLLGERESRKKAEAALAHQRGRRCCSCKTWIRPGSTVARFEGWRMPKHEIEERIHGDEVPMPDHFLCEECAGLYFSLVDLGYCYTVGDDVRELVREYAQMQAARAKEQK